MKQYNVALKADIDYDGFWDDMESETDGLLYIPNRRIEFTNERPASLRQCWYLLTDEEAELLRQDDRVYCVEIPPEFRTDIIMAPRVTQTGDFTKTSSDSGAYLNWGLIRSSNATNVYGTGTTTTGSYVYTLDGTGVDVVIQDSGLQVDHPEFQDSLGNSRVQQIDWGTTSGLFTQNANHYRDYDGHGTHVAGTAAGLTYGWAKNARIYSVKVGGLEGSGDSGGISISNCFDVIKEWHNNKPIDPNTGFKRPTIVNMSWGYSGPVSNVTSISYRGTTYNSSNDASWSTTPNTHMASTYGLYPYFAGFGYRYPVRVSSVDSDVEELIAAGVHVCIAAGNNRFKAEISGGIDYDNYFNSINNKYHRGSSPYSDNAMMVGSVDSTTSSGTDQISSFTTKGPGITLFAPGSNIRSAFSNTNRHADSTYYLNSSFKQGSISGTSMASPQVCGLGATVLQLNPHLTPAQLQLKLTNLASNNVLYTTNSGIDYADNRSLINAPNKLLYTPFNSSNVLSVT